MASTYDATTVPQSDKDFVRMWAGDRAAPFFLTDEEIASILVNETNKWCATASAIEMIRAKYALNLSAGGALIEKQVEDLRERFADAGVSGENTDKALVAYVMYLRMRCARETSKKPWMFRVLRRRP